MISDKKLAKISLAAALAGIAIIYLSIFFIGPQNTSIGKITQNDAGKQVSVSGVISSYNEANRNIFIILGDGTGNITVVIFERTARNQPSMKENDSVTVAGQINLYKNELEIIANTIRKVE